MLAFHCEGSGLIPGQSTQNMCWTKWHWDRFPCEYFSYFPRSIIPSMLHSHIHYMLLLP